MDQKPPTTQLNDERNLEIKKQKFDQHKAQINAVEHQLNVQMRNKEKNKAQKKRKQSSSRSRQNKKKKDKKRYEEGKQKKSKKSKKQKKRQSESSKRSSDSSSEGRNSRKGSAKRIQRKRSFSRQKQQKQHDQQIMYEKKISRPRLKINGGFLSNLIIDQKFCNKRLDEEDISNAGQKLQTKFKESRKPVTMSQFLSNQSLRITPNKQLESNVYKCELQKCLKEFKTIEQFQQHIEKHKQQL